MQFKGKPQHNLCGLMTVVVLIFFILLFFTMISICFEFEYLAGAADVINDEIIETLTKTMIVFILLLFFIISMMVVSEDGSNQLKNVYEMNKDRIGRMSLLLVFSYLGILIIAALLMGMSIAVAMTVKDHI